MINALLLIKDWNKKKSYICTNKCKADPIPNAFEITAAKNNWITLNELKITVLNRRVF